ncbi:16729_t:CDS:2, partial [Rhizophagus irregularis]
ENYLFSYCNSVEEFDDKLCLIDYEMIGEEILPPPPYSEKDDENLTALKESLPSPYNECDIKNNVKENGVQENNVQGDESSWFKTFKKIVKEVENLVDMAAKAHQAAVDNDNKRRLSSNPSKPELSEKEKEAAAINASMPMEYNHM